MAVGLAACAWNTASAGPIQIPNASFESPVVPPVSPYAGPDVDSWQKTAQPAWYDPSQNADTPWAYLMGTFYNVPFPGQFIDNCDGNQAAFLFALPEAGLFQDYDSVAGTNTTPSHDFNAQFNVGSTYELTVAGLGGGGGMKAGATLDLVVYYRNTTGDMVPVASTSITNSTDLFPTNTQFVDFHLQTPVVQASDPWAGQHVGIELLSTVSFELAGGYWDLDNVRLTETAVTGLTLKPGAVSNGQFQLTVLSPPGTAFEIQASTAFPMGTNAWISLGTYTNVTGVSTFSESTTGFNQRFYRLHQQ
ncbi:MAG: hypothetical protein ACREIC_12575 [Limisphaerales bacterium]